MVDPRERISFFVKNLGSLGNLYTSDSAVVTKKSSNGERDLTFDD